MLLGPLLPWLVLATGPLASGEEWQVDPDAAARRAADERRDLFLLFTGSAWCGSCIDFEA